MEMHERIKELRKKYLHLSQTEFGEKLGVSRSVINNIERNVLARPDQKSSLIKLMCSTFNINEDWILNGSGAMFIETPNTAMAQLQKEYNLNDFSSNLILQYLKLDPDKRRIVQDFFYKVVFNGNTVSTPSGELPKDPEDFEKLYPPIDVDNRRKSS